MLRSRWSSVLLTHRFVVPAAYVCVACFTVVDGFCDFVRKALAFLASRRFSYVAAGAYAVLLILTELARLESLALPAYAGAAMFVIGYAGHVLSSTRYGLAFAAICSFGLATAITFAAVLISYIVHGQPSMTPDSITPGHYALSVCLVSTLISMGIESRQWRKSAGQAKKDTALPHTDMRTTYAEQSRDARVPKAVA